jgi:glycosyltransferase 2 family protein
VSLLRRFRGSLLFSLALGLAVVVGLGVWADLSQLLQVLSAFRWELLPIVLALTFVNYLLRFVKWHYYVHLLGGRGIRWRPSMLIFFAGFAGAVTPGKAGEWIKSYLLKETTGMPISTSAPVILAERLTDGLAMIILASGGLLVYGYGREVMAAIILACVAVVLFGQQRGLAYWLFGRLEGAPAIGTRIHHLHAFYDSAYELLKLRNLALAMIISVFSWIWECVAFWLVLVGLGLAATPKLLLQATFILCSASVLGGASMAPGGLGVAEGSIAGMLEFLGATETPAVAAAASLIIRLCTLWFGVATGLFALMFVSRIIPGNAGPAEVQNG